MNGEFHADADRRNQDNHRNGTQLDSDEAHHAKELDRHQCQDSHLSEGTGMSGWAQTHSRYGKQGESGSPNVASLQINSQESPDT